MKILAMDPKLRIKSDLAEIIELKSVKQVILDS